MNRDIEAEIRRQTGATVLKLGAAFAYHGKGRKKEADTTSVPASPGGEGKDDEHSFRDALAIVAFMARS